MDFLIKHKYTIRRCRQSLIRSFINFGRLKNEKEPVNDIIFLDKMRALNVFENYPIRETQCIANGKNYNVVIWCDDFSLHDHNIFRRTTATILLYLQHCGGLEI